MFLSVFHLSLLFYMLFNAPGSIPVFVTLLKHHSPKKQNVIILRESVLALIFLLVFILCGTGLFRFLNISLYAFQFIGGILLCNVSLEMMTALPTTQEQKTLASDPVFYPLAFPVITGPAVITSLLSCIAEKAFPKEVIFLSIFVAWFFSTLTLLCSSLCNRLLKTSGLLALERLFSLSLLFMSVNLILKSISTAFSIGSLYS